MQGVILGTLILAAIIFLLILLVLLRLSKEKDSGLRVEKSVKEEISTNRTEMLNVLQSFRDSVSKQMSSLTQLNDQKLENVRSAVEERLKSLQDDNAKKLEDIRITVDEKLHSTLERRLGEQFKQVSDRLESVHKGLGEMQSLASSVKDLDKVLKNVKDRGTWAETQLGMLLEQILASDQYAKNVETKPGSNKRVEFAIKLPGRGTDLDKPVWLPVDAKFPQEDYYHLIQAREQADLVAMDKFEKQLHVRIKSEAKDIKEKYLDPPNTTDFGIMYLPTEGLYAEVARDYVLIQVLQRDYRVVVSGPNNFAAFLNSLQMGFKTLVIEKRSSEVWNLLGTVKTEFGKFGDILDKTHKKLREASNSIEDASRKTRSIERKLKNVQSLPSCETEEVNSDALELEYEGER